MTRTMEIKGASTKRIREVGREVCRAFVPGNKTEVHYDTICRLLGIKDPTIDDRRWAKKLEMGACTYSQFYVHTRLHHMKTAVKKKRKKKSV